MTVTTPAALKPALPRIALAVPALEALLKAGARPAALVPQMFADILASATHEPNQPALNREAPERKSKDDAVVLTAVVPVPEVPREQTALPFALEPALPIASAALVACLPNAEPPDAEPADAEAAKQIAATPQVKVNQPQTVPLFRFRSARPRPAEEARRAEEELKPASIAIAMPESVLPVPNPERASIPGSVAKQPELPFTPAASPTVTAEPGALRSGEVAFAAKLTPAPVSGPPELPAQARTNPEPAPIKPQSPVYHAAAPEPVATLAAHAVADAPRHQLAEPERNAEVREIQHPVEVLPDPAPARPTEPLRDISLRLVETGKEQVEVRLLERAGELRVSVRSADPQLNTELRNGLGELAGKLEKTGFQTETWNPHNEHTRPAEAAQTSNFKRDQEPRQHTGQQHPGHREQRASKTIRPVWVEEMTHSFSTGEESR